MADRLVTRGRKRAVDQESEQTTSAKTSKVQSESSLVEVIKEGFRSCVDEIMTRINLIESRLPSNSSSSILEQNREVSETSQSPRSFDGINNKTNSVYIMQPTITRPVFNGKSNVNPIRFLKKLKNYIRSINAEDRAIDVAISCLDGPALQLMELNSGNWTTYNEFEDSFLGFYWTRRHQEVAKNNLINARFDASRNLTMLEHFAEQMAIKNSLTSLDMDDRELLNCIMRQYPNNIQDLWFSNAGNVTTTDAIDLLKRLEQKRDNQNNTLNTFQNNRQNTVNRHSNNASFNRRGVSYPRRGTPITYNSSVPVTAYIRGRSNYANLGSRGAVRGRGRGRGRGLPRTIPNLPAINWVAASSSNSQIPNPGNNSNKTVNGNTLNVNTNKNQGNERQSNN